MSGAIKLHPGYFDRQAIYAVVSSWLLSRLDTDQMKFCPSCTRPGLLYWQQKHRGAVVGQSTFIMKKRRMMMTTLTWGWIHTADWPRLWGSPMCFTHVLLSNKVLMASRGISCEGKSRGARFSSMYCTSCIRELIPGLISPGLFLFCSPGESLPMGKTP